MGSALLAFVALLLINGSESGSSNTRRRSPTPAPSSHPADFDCPEEFGYYAHPTDCTQYYVCVFGGALLESCTGGLMYSHELQTCDWPRNVGCAAGTASQVQQEPESRPRQSQRIQQTPQHIPKHDLYTEEEQLGPAEEIETDRQQRVYRGQPQTIGQVASDRDAISTHSNAIPIPSGGRDKLSVVSYGNQQQYTRASVTPQQTYIEQQTPVPSRNYTQSRYVPSQYDNPFYNIYEDEVDLYKELANGDYQYNQNNQYRNQYKEKKPQIEIVQQEPLQRQTYSKNKYNTQSDVYQSVTPQEYDTYSIQTNDDIPYRQVQQKPSNRSEVKESESDGSERVVSAVSPGLAQEEANAKTETVTKTVLSRDDKIVRDFLIQVAQTPSPFKLEDSPVSLQTRGHFIVREPEVVNITPKPRNEQRKEEKRPIAIKIPDSAIDLNKYRNEPIRASDSLEWNRRPSIPEKRPLIRFSQPEDKQGDRGSSRFQESSYELEDFTEIPERQDKEEERRENEARKEEERKKAYELARIKQIEEAEKQAREESRQKQIEEYRRKQYAEEQEKKKAIETQRLREIEQKRRQEAEEARKRELEELRRQEIEETRRKELEEKRRREFEEARRRDQEEKRRKEIEELRRKELEEKRRKEIEEMRRKEIQEKEEARRRQLEQIRREEEEEKQREEKRKAIEEAERIRMEAIKRELERQKQEETRRKVEKDRPEGREQSYYYQTRKASSKIPERGFRIVVDTDDAITTRRPHTTDSKPPKKYLGRNSTLVNELYLNEQSTRPTPTPPLTDSTSQRMYTDQLRKTLDTPLPLSKTDPEKNLRVRPTTYDTQSTPGLTRGNSRHRGSHTYTVAPNEEEAAPNRGTPSARGRPTLKPSTTVIAKASEYIDIYRYPAHRPSNVYPTPQVDKTAAKCRKDVCLLPDCSCGGKDIPGDLSPEETPQIVLLTFDDSVNDLNKGLYSDLFEKGRVNPNGCPIAGTFYVSHEWTDYSQVQNLYANGHEIASHSVSHSFGEQFSQKKWTKEIAGQREILAAYGGVKLEDIRGMRAPFLAVGGNKMFKMLYDSNFTYDSSMPVYENRPPSWPYTLDYKIFHDCMIPPCPSRSYPGVWEVPMVMWQDLNGGRCSMGDACSNPPTSEGVYKMLIKNFERHFTTNRSPFGLFYHAAWFTQPHHKEGFIAFLDTINKMPEVWLVTNWQAIQWVRDPTPISRLNSFAPFQCNYPDRPKKCNNPKVCNLWHKSGVRYMRTCQPCPDVYPWTGKSGVRNSRVDNEIIQE